MNTTGSPLRKFSPLTILKFTGIATGIVGLTFLILQLLNIALFWAFYSSVFEKVQKLGGFEDSITSIVAIFITAVAMFVAPLTISAFFTGDHKKLLMVAGIASLWFLGTFIISRPRDGEYFNKLTGSPQYKYCVGVSGEISLHNIGYNFDPRTGQKLQLFTAEVARKYPEIISPKPKPTPQPVLAPNPTPVVIASLPSTPTATPAIPSSSPETPVAIRSANISEGWVPTPTRAPTPKAKSLMEVAQTAPICDDAENAELDPKSYPRKDISLQTSCWSGWIALAQATGAQRFWLDRRRFGIKNELGEVLLLLEDGRIITHNGLANKEILEMKFRLLGRGVAIVAVAYSAQELEDMLKTPLHKNSLGIFETARPVHVAEEPVSASVPTPTPKAKNLMEMAQNAPICDNAVDIFLDHSLAPVREIEIYRACWSGWIMPSDAEFSSVTSYNSYYGAKNEAGDVLFLLSDGRIIRNNLETKLSIYEMANLPRKKFRLLGSGTAIVAVGKNTKELKERLATPVHRESAE